MSILQDIKLIADSMDLGETVRQVCPSCWGGGSREKSLTVTLFPNNIVKFNCFRNACKTRGSYTRSGVNPYTAKDSEEPLAKPVKAKRKKFNGIVLPLTDFEKDWIGKVWGIESAPYWYHTPQFGGRIAMSVRSPKYAHRGWVLRDIYGGVKHKALTYIQDDEVPLCWYRNRQRKGTIIVEDIPSAVRASPYINSVALLGIGAGLERAHEIYRTASRPILIALDQDATQDAFKILERWGLFWGSAKVLPLKTDLKDMEEDDLKDLIKGGL